MRVRRIFRDERSGRYIRFSRTLDEDGMSTFSTVIGLAAAICTTAANWPQLKKAWVTGETDDLSLNTLLLFGGGLVLWVTYGVLREDFVIILANGLSLALLAALLFLKLAHLRSNSGSDTS